MINERTGEITTTLPFNRDAVSFVSFRVIVTDINGEKPRLQRGFSESILVHVTAGMIRLHVIQLFYKIFPLFLLSANFYSSVHYVERKKVAVVC